MEVERESQEIEETIPLLDSSTAANSNASNEDKAEIEGRGEGEDEGEVGGSTSSSKPNRRSVKTKVPEVEVHLYRQGKGPIAVFKSTLGGWDQDQLEVRDILDQYGLKCIYAFNPGSGRTVPIRFHSRNGRSMLPYKDGSVIYVDGEPKALSVSVCAHMCVLKTTFPCLHASCMKMEMENGKQDDMGVGVGDCGKRFQNCEDPMIKPVTKILVGVALITILIALIGKCGLVA
ncbi:hypothetical protein Ancab_036233 [Ancistrocladus abbreviatus]